jgi:hypothetical protein
MYILFAEQINTMKERIHRSSLTDDHNLLKVKY